MSQTFSFFLHNLHHFQQTEGPLMLRVMWWVKHFHQLHPYELHPWAAALFIISLFCVFSGHPRSSTIISVKSWRSLCMKRDGQWDLYQMTAGWLYICITPQNTPLHLRTQESDDPTPKNKTTAMQKKVPLQSPGNTIPSEAFPPGLRGSVCVLPQEVRSPGLLHTPSGLARIRRCQHPCVLKRALLHQGNWKKMNYHLILSVRGWGEWG